MFIAFDILIIKDSFYIHRAEMDALKKQIRRVCDEQYLVCTEDDDQDMSSSVGSQSGSSISSDWSDKILQLYQVGSLLVLICQAFRKCLL